MKTDMHEIHQRHHEHAHQEDHCDHEDHHEHEHSRSEDAKRLSLTLALVALFMLAELVGGWIANSLALLADAGHMLSDAGSLALALFALWIAQKPGTLRRTYGYRRAEILAALVNGATLLALAGFILFEAVQRLWTPEPVQGPLLLVIATGGLLVNLVSLKLLHSHDHENLNMRAAWLHVVTDALGSVGAIAAGVFVWLGMPVADPVASMLIACLVLYSGWRLLQETVDVLMEAAPQNIDITELRAALARQPGVRAVHDLHVWTITSGMVAMSGHIEIEHDTTPPDLLRSTTHLLEDRFSIRHVTLQIEPPSLQPCPQGKNCAVAPIS